MKNESLQLVLSVAMLLVALASLILQLLTLTR